MTIVKVGGSLYSLPNLGEKLRQWLAGQGLCLVVPGGGAGADVVREWHRIHHLSEESSHWAALASLVPAQRLLQELLQGAAPVLNAWDFCQHDERNRDALPHTWAVTSDSLAARVAEVSHAKRLVLLKSITIPADTPWPDAHANGWVDGYFPTIAKRLTCPIVTVNFLTTAAA